MKNIRNILLIGKTGNGKSALANVITGTDEFKEGRYSVSKTKKIQTEEFEYQGVKYRVIDTIGISDTKEGTEMSLNKVLYNLAKVGYVVKDGLSQILLVTDGSDKSWKQEISLYNLLKETIFDENISQHTTIAKTRFANFEDEKECEKDRQILSKDSGEEVSKFVNELIKESSNKIIYVDNPPIDIPGEGKRVEQQKKLNVETREISREVLLKYLVAYENIYKPANLSKLNKIIAKGWKDKELLREKINKEFIKHIKERGSNLKKEVKDELKKLQEEIEERELSQATLNENELTKQIGNQLIRELKELNSYLPENEKFIEWKKKISQSKEGMIRDRERKLVGEIIINRENIIAIIKENIEEKKKHLQKVKNDNEEKVKEITKKSKKFLNISNLLEGNDSKNWIQESLEKICQAQTELTKSELELETIKKILVRIESYKEQLEQQLEARIEVFPK